MGTDNNAGWSTVRQGPCWRIDSLYALRVRALTAHWPACWSPGLGRERATPSFFTFTPQGRWSPAATPIAPSLIRQKHPLPWVFSLAFSQTAAPFPLTRETVSGLRGEQTTMLRNNQLRPGPARLCCPAQSRASISSVKTGLAMTPTSQSCSED